MSVLISGDSFLDEGIVSNYYMVKDKTWPNIKTPADFYNLSKVIRNEVLNDHSLTIDTKPFLRSYGDDRINMARAGAGNEYIAHSIIETCVTENIDFVFVLWSGISRVDVSFGDHVIGSINETSNHCTQINARNWMHCGGMIGSHLGLKKDNILKRYIATQHKEYDDMYLTNATLYNVLVAQEFLKHNNIDYKFGFIYNPHVNYDINDDVNVYSEGSLNTESKLYDSVDWGQFLDSYPYNWCKSRNMLEDDKFHPTDDGMSAWYETL
jgi:hypothetical protein